MKTRRNLTVYYQNEKGLRERCGLCGQNVKEKGHHPTCAFRDASVTHVEITPLKTVVTLGRFSDNAYIWASPTGTVYRVKRETVGQGFSLRKVGERKPIIVLNRLSNIRTYIERNQGTL